MAISRHIVFSAIILVILILITIETPCFAAENSIVWTEDELAFMEEHPVIRLGVDPEFVPFEFIDENGEYRGIAADGQGCIIATIWCHYLKRIRSKRRIQKKRSLVLT